MMTEFSFLGELSLKIQDSRICTIFEQCNFINTGIIFL